jgi:DNA-binding IclR family transcriptional regulator
LLDHTREEVLGLFAGVRFDRLGPNTPRTAAELDDRIEEARARGYAVVDEEFEPGLVGVAAPVRDFRGRIAAAVNVSAPKFRLGDRFEQSGERVAEAAGRISALADVPLSVRADGS